MVLHIGYTPFSRWFDQELRAAVRHQPQLAQIHVWKALVFVPTFSIPSFNRCQEQSQHKPTVQRFQSTRSSIVCVCLVRYPCTGAGFFSTHALQGWLGRKDARVSLLSCDLRRCLLSSSFLWSHHISETCRRMGKTFYIFSPQNHFNCWFPPLPKVLRCTICKGKVFFFSHSQNLPVLSLLWGRGLLQESFALAELWLQCLGCRNRRILGSKIVCFPCDGRIGYLKERDFHFWSWCSRRMMCKEGSVTGLVETAVVSSLQKAKQQDVHHSYTSAWNSISSASWGAAPARIKGSEPRGLQTGKSNSECISHYGKD